MTKTLREMVNLKEGDIVCHVTYWGTTTGKITRILRNAKGEIKYAALETAPGCGIDLFYDDEIELA